MENKQVVDRGEMGGKIAEGNYEVQISSFKWNKSLGYNIQHKEYGH